MPTTYSYTFTKTVSTEFFTISKNLYVSLFDTAKISILFETTKYFQLKNIKDENKFFYPKPFISLRTLLYAFSYFGRSNNEM